jgi:NAD(P)-dependent dehydrogenase (short-subunit alcohol dehydrogenase family)
MPQNAGEMAGKVCVVTGATSGIGEVTARELAKRGATVVLVCRSRDKGAATQNAIRSETGNQNVELVIADLASLADVRRGAAEILSRSDRLDVLVNNAGAMNTSRSTTADGIETTFGVNHLAPFLLTHLLLDRLKSSAPSRIITVASAAHYRVGLDLDDLEAKRSYSALKVYSQSKLCNVLFTYELAKRLEGTSVTANCLHPGVITSGFGKNDGGIFAVLIGIAGIFMISPDKGARTSIYLATSKDVANVSGKYFDSDTKEKKSSRVSRDPELAQKLWKISEQMTGVS